MQGWNPRFLCLCISRQDYLPLATWEDYTVFVVVVQLLSCVWLFCNPMNTRLSCPSPSPGVHIKLTSIESVMLSNHLILQHPLLLLPSIIPLVFLKWNVTLRFVWSYHKDNTCLLGNVLSLLKYTKDLVLYSRYLKTCCRNEEMMKKRMNWWKESKSLAIPLSSNMSL